VNFLPLIALYDKELESLARQKAETLKMLAEIDESKRVASGAKAYCELQVKRQQEKERTNENHD